MPGAAYDEPVAQVTKTGARSWFHADERGSVIAGSNNSGVNERIVPYDENGRRGGNLSYRFAFTGQVHLINDVYDYKTRNYNARLPRFLQTDRIGLGGGMNTYVYGGGDPVNRVDPHGRSTLPISLTVQGQDIYDRHDGSQRSFANNSSERVLTDFMTPTFGLDQLSSFIIGAPPGSPCLQLTCSFLRFQMLDTKKDIACNSDDLRPQSCYQGMSADRLFANEIRFKICAAARKAVVTECYGGKADTGHQQAIDDNYKGAARCARIANPKELNYCPVPGR